MFSSSMKHFQHRFWVLFFCGFVLSWMFISTGCDLGTHENRVQERHGELDPMKRTGNSGTRVN
jgi:hypothetical protein